MEILKLIFSWSEVWALLIPLSVWLYRRNQPPAMQPVIVYLFIALLLNTLCDIIGTYWRHFPKSINFNTYLYNVHSIVRFVCFSYFFLQITPLISKKIVWVRLGVFLLLITLNFIFIENFFNEKHLSGNLLATEAFIMLTSCMSYYLALLKSETPQYANRKDFWVITGLSIFYVISFFIFLFYVTMLTENEHLAGWMWNFHNAAYLLLCIFIVRAFYVSTGN